MVGICFPIPMNGKTRVSCSGRTTGTKSQYPDGHSDQPLILLAVSTSCWLYMTHARVLCPLLASQLPLLPICIPH